jgi:hypothetical protein
MAFLAGIDTTKVHTSMDYKVGSLAMNTTSDGTKIYKFVLYDTGAGSVAAVSGQACYYYAPGGVSTGVVTVTSDLSDSAEIGAGILQSAPADGEYCWIQVSGLATMSIALTAGADGDPLTATGATDGTLDVTALATDPIVATAVDASAKIILCRFPM